MYWQSQNKIVLQLRTADRLPANLSVPEELGRYLDGIGNIVDFSGRESFLRLLLRPQRQRYAGLAGHYGPVAPDSHCAYETVPAPFIAAYRMCYKFGRYQSRRPAPPGAEAPDVWPEVWNLPPALAPAGVFIPNRNLLGWSAADDLTAEMARIFDRNVNVDVEAETFEVVNIPHVQNIPIFDDILQHISVLLSTTKSSPQINLYKAEVTFKGSVAQVPYQTRSRNDYGNNESGMALVPLAERMLQTQSYNTLGPHITSATTVFRYRIERYVADSSDCLCYTTRQGGAPPHWVKTANDAFQQVKWNFPDFNGPLTTGSHVSEQLICQIRKVHRLDA